MSVPFFAQAMGPICLIVGNEINGLSKTLLSNADAIVSIPMLGEKESLNVACAYTVAAYEILRQYKNNKKK